MRRLHPHPLNASGLAHFILPLLIIVSIGLVGTYLVVSSGASPWYCKSDDKKLQEQNKYYTDCQEKDSTQTAVNCSPTASAQGGPVSRCPSTPQKPGCNASAGYYRDYSSGQCVKRCPTGYTAVNQKCTRDALPPCSGSDSAFLSCVSARSPERRQAKEKSRVNTIGQRDRSKSGTESSGQIAGGYSSKDPQNQVIPATSSVPPTLAEYVKPTGNVTIVTYLDDPKTKNTNDRRLGLVNVSLERVGAQLKCANRKVSTAKTNGTKYRKGTKVLVKGTVHFLNCEVGQYKASMIGRKNYKLASGVDANIKIFNLSNNETQVVSFVLEKSKDSTGP